MPFAILHASQQSQQHIHGGSSTILDCCVQVGLVFVIDIWHHSRCGAALRVHNSCALAFHAELFRILCLNEEPERIQFVGSDGVQHGIMPEITGTTAEEPLPERSRLAKCVAKPVYGVADGLVDVFPDLAFPKLEPLCFIGRQDFPKRRFIQEHCGDLDNSLCRIHPKDAGADSVAWFIYFVCTQAAP